MINTINQRQRFPYWCHSCQKETFPTENESGSPVCGFCRNTFIEEINSFNQNSQLDQNRELNPNQPLFQTAQVLPQGRRAQSASRMPYNRIEAFNLNGGGRNSALITYSFSYAPLYRQNGSIENLLDNPILTLILGNNNPFGEFLTRHSQGDVAFENLLNIIMQNDSNRYGNPPASQTEIQELKKESIDKSTQNKFESMECSVCKEKYKIEDQIITMPCTHVFHSECLVPWLNLHNSCPVCRYELKTDDPDYENRKKELRRTLSNSTNGDNQSDTGNRDVRDVSYPRRSGSQQTGRRT